MSSHTRFVTKTSTTQMPSSCWGRYERIGLLEVDPDEVPVGGPTMISTHARGVVRVVDTWERRFRGTSSRCAAELAEMEACLEAARLNAEAEAAEIAAGVPAEVAKARTLRARGL